MYLPVLQKNHEKQIKEYDLSRTTAYLVVIEA